MEQNLIAIISHAHNRFVFCSHADYRDRHTKSHLPVFYHEFTASGLTQRPLKLLVEAENIHWEVNTEGNFAL